MPHKLITVPSKKQKLPLSVTHPELSKEADGWDPNTVTSGSAKKVAWICKKEHSWTAAVYSRTSKFPGGCPYCSGQKVLTGFNDLATKFPEIASQAVGWDAGIINPGSSRKFNWKCPLGHIYEATPGNRTRSLTGCPICSGNKVLAGFNDLATTHPELAKEADGWDPTQVSKGSPIKRIWKCEKSHTWSATPNDRSRKNEGTNCPYCANQKLLVGYNDLETTHPELAKQAFQWDPKSKVAGSGNKVSWKCNYGHIWKATINSRAGQNIGCPICSNKKILKGFNDLATTNPTLASQAYKWDPSTISGGSSKAAQWICENKHTWTASVSARNLQNEGCPYCSNQKILVGYNDFATTHPELASEADGWDPTKYNAGSIEKVSWICPLQHRYKSTIRDRGRRNTNCPVCAGRTVLIGFNDLQTINPNLSAQAYKWDPRTVTAGSQKIVEWKCTEGHVWKATVANRNVGERGCPSCAKTGFDPNKDGHLYFLTHPDWEMLQIGITNVPDKRISEHRTLGWQLLEIRGPMDGHLTQQWETAILRMLKAKGADLSNNKIAGKFDGYSEAWSKSTFEVESIKELMKLTEEFENE